MTSSPLPFGPTRARHARPLALALSLIRFAFTFAFTFAFMLALTSPARAELVLALDGEVAAPLAPTRVSTGAGAQLRAGYELDTTLVALTPEIGGGYHDFGGDLSPDVVRGFGGARLGFFTLVRPGIFAHVGVGHVANRNATPPETAATSRTAAAFDAGVFLDLTLVPHLDLGLHGSYANIASGEGQAPNAWLAAGAHAALSF